MKHILEKLFFTILLAGPLLGQAQEFKISKVELTPELAFGAKPVLLELCIWQCSKQEQDWFLFTPLPI